MTTLSRRQRSMAIGLANNRTASTFIEMISRSIFLCLLCIIVQSCATTHTFAAASYAEPDDLFNELDRPSEYHSTFLFIYFLVPKNNKSGTRYANISSYPDFFLFRLIITTYVGTMEYSMFATFHMTYIVIPRSICSGLFFCYKNSIIHIFRLHFFPAECTLVYWTPSTELIRKQK